MGMIYQRGKVYWIKYYRNGKPYRESTRSKKEADAKRLLKKREGEISQGKLPGIYFDRVTFDELAEDLLSDYRINQNKSLKRAEISIGHLREAFEGMKVPNITTKRIMDYIEGRLAWKCGECEKAFRPETVEPDQGSICPFCGAEEALKRGVAHATVNRELAALKRMLTLGARQNPPKVDRVPYIPRLKENNVRKGFFEHKDFLALRIALPAYLRGLATFGYKYGCRSSEIRDLTWDRVDLERGIVRFEVGETKNDDARTLVLDSELKEIFQKQRAMRERTKMPVPYVFPNAEGTGKIVNYYNAWRKACKASGIGDRLFHDLRRTAIRNMIRSGTPEVVAMKISGHRTRAVFDRYNIVNEDDIRQASDRLCNYLESAQENVTGTITGTTL